MSFLSWLHEQATATANTVMAVASNSPEPARATIVHLIAAAVACTALIAILRRFAK